MEVLRKIWCGLVLVACAMLGGVGPVAAQEPCTIKADLAPNFTDANCDLLADMPTDPNALKDPKTLVWAYTPIEDAAIYADLFKPFTRHLAKCVGRQIVYYPVQSEIAQVRAFANGRLHFAGFATGATVAAVNMAGAHPFAAKGTAEGMRGYHLIAIVRADSPFHSLKDLAGMRIAHTTKRSNSGNHAAKFYFAQHGLEPGKDYHPIMSGGHAQSILGVLGGDYEMAAVASDVFVRMAERGRINKDDFRILYKSPLFPTSSFALAHDLKPGLAEKLKSCFFNFTFPQQMSKAFQGDNRFIPVHYQTDWEAVRTIVSMTRLKPD
ncbi:phosphate/phosphite/phosphonate ABC transporter substrate-binding protein [Cohaesibacter intestini]|uniref:phosphate/phosphite/phosphonate ABC transporter substrate-binding protein n=1 Tax=Cohaesibacter intestini TaxID=2211145 RepID=UPI001FDFDAC1|nr:phosphate/phosphite/phosphonate ABC transporter substrate-binding protein [Cohaesibacter intestini]